MEPGNGLELANDLLYLIKLQRAQKIGGYTVQDALLGLGK